MVGAAVRDLLFFAVIAFGIAINAVIVNALLSAAARRLRLWRALRAQAPGMPRHPR